MIDTGHIFNGGKNFKSHDELIAQVRKIGLLHDIHVRLDTYHPRRGYGVHWLKCDKSGPYQFRGNFDVPSTKSYTGTKKCWCPFKLKAVGQVDGTWRLDVHNGFHNHFIGVKDNVLTAETKEFILSMTASKISVANILIELRKKDINVTSKQVYNVHAREKKNCRGDRTTAEQLLKLADDHGYRTFHDTIPGKKRY
ncbi:uncharacterized protein LOC141643440 [Silene latifolia]|uniref:uncharacterized protein LOC141643440 n=1 Tax=Silene latifolia TaxID=37657 RepID=UPI003D77EA17